MARCATRALILATAAGTARAQDAAPALRLVSPTALLAGAAAAIALVVYLWWKREQRIQAQHESLRIFHGLSEDIIAAPTPAAIAEKLATVLPVVTEATHANLYLFQRRTKSLERVPTSVEPEPMAAAIDAPPDGLVNAAVVCFRNRTLLNIPDVRRNPLVKGAGYAGLPRSAMLVPLFSQQEVLGVLEISNARRPGFFSPEEQQAVQHLANQAAASLKLQERRVMREQLFHSERMAAIGQLISGVASELRSPIGNIAQLAASLAAQQGTSPPRRDLLRLAAESQRASEIVSRLVSFAREDQPAEPSIVDVNAVCAELFRFRGPEWRSLGLRGQDKLSAEPAPVLGSRGQIEQVFLNLLMHAEQHAVESAAKTISIHSSVLAQRVVVEIAYSTLLDDSESTADPFSPASLMGGEALGLGVCQGIVRSHGGEVRFRNRGGLARFETELPVAGSVEQAAASGEARKASRPLTLMLVDPDAGTQRQLLGLLSARAHRAVPVARQEAAELSKRLRFDAVFWAVHPGNGRLTESHEAIRENTPAFVLVSDGYDPELARGLERSQGFLLSRPIQESDLDRILSAVEVLTRPQAT
jgi:signal transduction histidine kinase